MYRQIQILLTVLTVLLIFSLCACTPSQPVKEPTPTVEATPTPKPDSALERWIFRAEDRYNMKYDNFNDYWCMLCDEYFGEDMHKLLDAVSACEKANYNLEENNRQISEKRAEYKKRGGRDWSFKISGCTVTPLDEKVCSNFSDELKSIHDIICGVTSKAPNWSDYDWADFAESMGCDVANVKSIIDAYSAIAEKCNEINVTSAAAVELTVEFSDGSSITDSTTLYEINGEYVSTELIDAASLLIQLIYF